MDAKSKKKLAELEERVKQLEAKPAMVIYQTYPQPYYVWPYIPPSITTVSGNYTMCSDIAEEARGRIESALLSS